MARVKGAGGEWFSNCVYSQTMNTQQPSRRPAPRDRIVLAASLLLGVSGILLTGPAGCSTDSGHTTDDPMVDLKNKECTPEERVQAVDRAWEQAVNGELDLTNVRDQFKASLFLLGSTEPVRQRIVEKLLSDTSDAGVADTRNVLRLRLPRETSWPIIGMICDAAVARQWTDLTPALVRSYARKVNDPTDDKRPERAALLALNPGKTIEEIVYDVFILQRSAPGASDAARMLDERARTDAWDLLGRLDTDGTKRAALIASDVRISQDAAPSPAPVTPTAGAVPATKPTRLGTAAVDTMLVDLRAAAADLRAVPTTGTELEWVRALRSPGNTLNERWWREATAAIRTLAPEQTAGLEVRHAEAIRWASLGRPAWLKQGREELRSELAARLRGRIHDDRTSEEGDFGARVTESLDDWDAKMVWGDLLTILVIDEALRDPRLVEQLVMQSVEDRSNERTELGGAIEAFASIGPGSGPASGPVAAGASDSADLARFDARLYPPQVGSRSSDDKYIASERMIAATVRCLAHYHFHAQKEKNAAYAGPSKGDMSYAATYARNCLVFTGVGRNTLGVDYYQRNGVRIDLGQIRFEK